jgi:hypothetical protein
VVAFCQGLERERYTSLEPLGLSGNQIKHKGVRPVASLIARNDQLTFICQVNHLGGDKSLVQIENAEKMHTTMESLNVICGSLGSIG